MSSYSGPADKICYKCIAILIKGLSFGITKLMISVFLDPVIIILETYKKWVYKEGSFAILIVDAQMDFTKSGKQIMDNIEYNYEDGKLGVIDGYAIVPAVNALLDRLTPNNFAVASLDWHPKGHKSFASSTPGTQAFVDKIILSGQEQILWPDHCIQGSDGAKFLNGLKIDKIQYIVKKGTELFVDSYSAFFDNNKKNKTTLDEYLKSKNVKHLILAGIATDYCVKYTALDALELGYKVTIVLDAIRGVSAVDSAKAIEELLVKGVNITTLKEIINNFG